MSKSAQEFFQEEKDRQAEKERRIMTGPICPILSITEEVFQLCLEARCGFWNKEKQHCGIANL